MRVLDFGCGSGEFVYQLRDRGFDAYGFDMFDVAKPRCRADARLFSFLERRDNAADTRIADDEMRLPYDTASFDFIISLTVIEHCHALDGMLRECARVLKPGGASLHLYPSRNQVLEPHIYVPFGGRIQSDWWLKMWARLGVRNQFQQSLTPAETVHQNQNYIASGLAYRPDSEIRNIAARHFGTAAFVDRRFYGPDPILSRAKRAWEARKSLQQLASIVRCRVLLLAQPCQTARDS